MADAFEYIVDPRGKALFPAGIILVTRFKENRAKHRRGSKRDNGRYRNRTNQRKGEFGKQRARQPALKADRDIDRDQHDGHRDDRRRQLACGENGGIDGA